MNTETVSLQRVKIDLDRKFSACKWVKWCRHAAARLGVLGIVPIELEVHETGRGFHVILTVPSNSFSSTAEVVAIQALLGSDGMREAYNLRRHLRGDPGDWNVLFEEKRKYVEGENVLATRRLPAIRFTRILADAIMREIKAQEKTLEV